jgi:hypothetical protein
MANFTLLEIWRPRPAWYALSNQKKKDFVARSGEVLGAVMEKGAKITGVFKCRAASSDGWDMMGYWEMPSFDLVGELADRLDKMGWNRYFEQINFVGTATTAEDYLKSLVVESEF